MNIEKLLDKSDKELGLTDSIENESLNEKGILKKVARGIFGSSDPNNQPDLVNKALARDKKGNAKSVVAEVGDQAYDGIEKTATAIAKGVSKIKAKFDEKKKKNQPVKESIELNETYYVTLYRPDFASGPEEGGYTTEGKVAVISKPYKTKEEATKARDAYIDEGDKIVFEGENFIRFLGADDGEEYLVAIETESERGQDHRPAKTWDEFESDVDWTKVWPKFNPVTYRYDGEEYRESLKEDINKDVLNKNDYTIRSINKKLTDAGFQKSEKVTRIVPNRTNNLGHYAKVNGNGFKFVDYDKFIRFTYIGRQQEKKNEIKDYLKSLGYEFNNNSDDIIVPEEYRESLKESYSSENFNETTLDEIIAGEIDNMMSDDIDKDLKLFNRIKKILKQKNENEIVVLISDYFDFDIYELDENTYKVEMIKELNPATAVYKIADDLIMVQEHRNGKVFDYFANEEDANRFKAIIDNTYDFNESLNESSNFYGDKAWKLNEIIFSMNNEDAYYGNWLYIWPDGENYENALEDFGDKESYQELENTFIRIYKKYHRDGLFRAKEDVIENAHKWDEKLGLPLIKDTAKESEEADDFYESSDEYNQLLTLLDKNDVAYDDIIFADGEDNTFEITFWSLENMKIALSILKSNLDKSKTKISFNPSSYDPYIVVRFIK